MKKNTIYLLGIFLLIISFVDAQQKIIDSLENQLLNPTSRNTRLENLIQLGHYYSMNNPEKGLMRLDEAVQLSTVEKDSFKLGTAFGNKGKNYISLGKDSLAFIFYDRAETIFRAIDSSRALSKLMFNKGLLYSERSNYQSAVNNVQNALEIFSENRDTLLMGYSLGTLGYYHIYLGDYTTSMEAFLRGMTLLEQINQEESILYASAQGNMGILYQKLGDLDVALKLHQKALEIFEKNDNEYLMASQYAELGNIYEQKRKFEKALINYQAAYLIDKKNQNIGRMAGSLGNIGLIYSHQKKYDRAIIYLDSAMIINKDLKDYGKLSINHHNKGEVYYHKNEVLMARKNFDSSLVYAKKLGDKRMVYEAKLGVSLMASIQRDYKTAFNVLDEAVIIRDTLLSDEKKEELATLKAKYKYEKEKAVLKVEFEKNKVLDEAKIKQQTLVKNVSIGAGIFSVTILAIGFTLFRRKKEADLNAKLVTSELQKLRAQLNPHFVFNSLNSINDYVQKNQKDKASNYLVRFSSMMRKILDNSKEEEVLLSEEIEFLENYIKLEQQRLTDAFTYSIAIDETINIDEILVPPSLLQPFIENSIWHGLSEKKKNGRLTITFSKEQNELICTIDDNGVGIKPKQNTNKKSFGTSSAQNRIDLLNKLKGSDAQIDFVKKEEGVRVIIRLPLSLEF